MPLILYHREFEFKNKTVETAKGTLFIYKQKELNVLKSLNDEHIDKLSGPYKLLKRKKGILLSQEIKKNLRNWLQFPSSGSHLRGQKGIGPNKSEFIFKSTKYREPSYTFIVQGII